MSFENEEKLRKNKWYKKKMLNKQALKLLNISKKIENYRLKQKYDNKDDIIELKEVVSKLNAAVDILNSIT